MYHSGNQLIDPQLLFAKAHLQSGMQVADFGCGRTGHIIFPAAKVLGERSVIYAIDILKDVLEEICKRAAGSGLLSIHPVWANVEQVGAIAIPEKSLDVVFLVNILWHASNSSHILDEARRLLKDKGRLLIVDWRFATLSFGPRSDHLVDRKTVKEWGQKKGCVVQEEFIAGPYHWGLVLFKQD